MGAARIRRREPSCSSPPLISFLYTAGSQVVGEVDDPAQKRKVPCTTRGALRRRSVPRLLFTPQTDCYPGARRESNMSSVLDWRNPRLADVQRDKAASMREGSTAKLSRHPSDDHGAAKQRGWVLKTLTSLEKKRRRLTPSKSTPPRPTLNACMHPLARSRLRPIGRSNARHEAHPFFGQRTTNANKRRDRHGRE